MKKYIEKIEEIFIKNWKWIILVFCIINFLIIAKNVFNKQIINIDLIRTKYYRK